MPPALALLTLLLAVSPLGGGFAENEGPPGPPARAFPTSVPSARVGSVGSAGSVGSGGSVGSVGSVGSAGWAASVGSLTGVWPLDPRPTVVARFEPPVFRYGPGHRGVDLAASLGQVVHTAAAGRVVFAGSVAGRGVVVVGHGATRTTYEPVRASVKVGAEVAAGDPIGTLERFGSHCWPDVCLHWGLIEGDAYLDPLTLLGLGPVRLLPQCSFTMLGTGGCTAPVARLPTAPGQAVTR